MVVGAGDRSLKFQIQHETETCDGPAPAGANPLRLRVAFQDGVAKLRWVKFRYRSSFFDDPVRPLIVFVDAAGREVVHAMNGPVLGIGEWIGRVPDGTVSIAIVPTWRREGTSFEILAIESVSKLELVRRGISYDRDAVMWAVGAKFIGAKEERWETLKFAATPTPLENYAEWYSRLHRPLDKNSIDRPRSDWMSGPVFRFIMPLERGGAQGIRATIASLRSQHYQRWTVDGVSSTRTAPELLTAFLVETEGDPRFGERPEQSSMFDPKDRNIGNEHVALIDVGDTLADCATAVLAEVIAGDPKPCVTYSDEDAASDSLDLHSPVFKPDWSPNFFAGRNYVGRLTCIKAGQLHALGVQGLGDFINNEQSVLSKVCFSLPGDDIRHVRRVLYRRRGERRTAHPPQIKTGASTNSPGIARPSLPRVSIVIPSRDRAHLLRDCVESLTRLTNYPRYDVVVVDNGSADAEALTLLASLAEKPGFKVVKSPGPFNFSSLSNVGARATDTELLVFLNNDTVIFDGNWLAALVEWAVRPEVGVVGAKLLFPNRTLEHAGVVLGHSGIAGHLYHGHSEDERGNLDHLTVPHEVMAITGACFAVRRETFEAAGGFDAENLPVDLNDIDFCLNVAALGLTNMWTPHCVLYHLQSASRGFKFKPFEVYRKEREFFRKKWAHIIQDDRYFHPALSLYSYRIALA